MSINKPIKKPDAVISLFALKMQTRKDQQTIYKVFYARKAYTNENFQIWMNSHSAQLGKITKKKKKNCWNRQLKSKSPVKTHIAVH